MALSMEKAPVKVDPVTFEVIRHRLLAMTDEQAAALAAISGSPLVTEATDFNVGLYCPDGSVAAMGRTILFHASTMTAIVRHVIADCRENPGIGPDDMFVVNNPWKGAVHAQDMGIVAPIFHEGDLIAWSGAMCHMLDVGGMRPSSFCFDATEMYQEGLQLPPTKLMAAGELRRDVWELILAHTRMPATMNLDMKGLIAANNTAARGFARLVGRYGVETVSAVMDGLIRLSEDRLRRRLRELPDGVIRSTAFLDNHGAGDKVYQVALELTKQDDRLVFDYSGSSPQVPAYINCTWSGLMAGISAALLPTIAYDLPWNAGLYRPIEVICPEGLICNAKRPAAVSGGVLEALWLVEMTSTEALSKLAACSDAYLREAQAGPAGGPDIFLLFGTNHHGERATHVFLDCLATGGGAYSHRDGVWTQGQHNIEREKISNVEPLEQDVPVLYLWRGLAQDSGGAGRRRGGLTMGATYVLHKTDGAHALCSGHGWEVPNSMGIFGGYPGTENDRVLIRNANIRELMAHGDVPGVADVTGEVTPTKGRQGIFPLGPHDVLAITPQAGGGWGDPLERPPEEVQADLDFGAVSAEKAVTLYGVVLDKTGRVDFQSTARRRQETRAARRQWPVERRLAGGPEAGALERVCPLGDGMEIVRDKVSGRCFTRCACGYLLAPANENWRHYACLGLAAIDEVGPSTRLNPTMEIRRYACAGCGRLLSVDVAFKGSLHLHDIQLAL